MIPPRMPIVGRLESTVARYGGGIAIVAATVAARWLLEPVLENRLSYVAVLLASVLTLWFCGTGPATFAFVLCLAASYVLSGAALRQLPLRRVGPDRSSRAHRP
jgi:hypothetical protein